MVTFRQKSFFLYLIIALRIVVGFVLFLSGLNKILNFDNFTNVVFSYNILPMSITPIFSFILPIIEYCFGLFLIFGLQIRISATVSAFLFVTFIIAVGINIFRGNDSSCGCFTFIQENKIGYPLLIKDIFLFFAALIIYFKGGNNIFNFPNIKHLSNFIFKYKPSFKKYFFITSILSSLILLFSFGINSKQKLLSVENLFKHKAVNFYSEKVDFSKFRGKNLWVQPIDPNIISHRKLLLSLNQMLMKFRNDDFRIIVFSIKPIIQNNFYNFIKNISYPIIPNTDKFYQSNKQNFKTAFLINKKGEVVYSTNSYPLEPSKIKFIIQDQLSNSSREEENIFEKKKKFPILSVVNPDTKAIEKTNYALHKYTIFTYISNFCMQCKSKYRFNTLAKVENQISLKNNNIRNLIVLSNKYQIRDINNFNKIYGSDFSFSILDEKNQIKIDRFLAQSDLITPITFIVDRSGMLVYVEEKMMPEDNIFEKVISYLN